MQIIKIFYDEEKNDINMEAPPDAVLTLGILEMAKVAFTEKLRSGIKTVQLANVMVPKLDGHFKTES